MNKLFSYNLTNKIKLVWKTLVVLFLFVLLVAPKPALALDNGTLQSYLSNTKVELDSVLTSIKKLPNLSYENGKTTLAEIDVKLQKIQTDTGNRAKDFKKLSDEAQIKYEKVLGEISKQYASQQKGQVVLSAYQENNLPSITNGLNNAVSINIFAEGQWNYGSQSPFNRLVNANGNTVSAGRYQKNLRFPNLNPAALVTIKNNQSVGYGMQHSLVLLPGETVSFISNDIGGNYGDNAGNQLITYSFSNDDKNYFFSKDNQNATIKSLTKELDIQKQNLADGIVLTNQISVVSDHLEKRVNLAKQKLGNVKDYADILKSFSDPDLLGEISELDKFIADLTKNLPNVS